MRDDLDGRGSRVRHGPRTSARSPALRCRDADAGGRCGVAALRAYQNPDGGFGNALEPDIRGWSSQPVGAQIALELLVEADRPEDEMVGPLLSWCSDNSADGGLPLALAGVEEAARAPWWVPESRGSLNPTAAVVGSARTLGLDHPWLDSAEAFCWPALAEQVESLDAHAALCATALVESSGATPAGLADALAERVVGHLAQIDPTAGGYAISPLQFAPTPDSLARALFDDAVIDAHLAALEAGQQDDGGWPITWDPPTAGAVNEWRGQATVNALTTLTAYGRR